MAEYKTADWEETFNMTMAEPDVYVINQKIVNGKRVQSTVENLDARTYVATYDQINQAIVRTGEDVQQMQEKIASRKTEIEKLKMRLEEMNKFVNNAKLHVELLDKEAERKKKDNN